MEMRLKMRWIVATLIAIVAIAAAFTFYERTRPHLAERSQSDYLRDVHQVIGSLRGEERRAAVAAGREFLLDYPSADEPRLRLELAMLMADMPDADMESVANETERVALYVLSRARPNRLPTQQDFQKMGFRFGKYGYDYGDYGSWPTPFIVTDVDGDNQRDVLFSCPGGEYSYYGSTMQPGVCLLFRQTPQGWTKHRLGIGVPVIGLWTFDVTKSGPKAVVLASLADSAYRPNLFFDVFVWQGGRMSNVLTTKISEGWQWEHKDVDGDGLQEIRVFGSEPSRRWRERNNLIVTTYKWNGSRFAPHQTEKEPTASQPLLEGKRLFSAGRHREAARAFQAVVENRGGGEYFDRETDRRIAWYYLGICRALFGNYVEAVQAMTEAQQRRSRESDGISIFARKFLHACPHPGDLPKAIGTIGQMFRAVEWAQQTSRPNASPKDVLTTAGYPPDFYQDVDLTGDGKPEVLARFGWTGGGAVVAFDGAWSRDHAPSEQAKQWTTWLLAYAHKDKAPEWAYPLEVDELFYLPQVPALQPYPVASDVKVKAVQSRGKYPQVVIEHQNADGKYRSEVQWNGERFVATVPTSREASGNLLGELNRIETYLFERKEFAETLTLLDAFAQQVRRSSLPSEEKNDLLLEVYYHQAICYRKSGQTRKASVTLTALWRGQPKNVWGRLAKKWLRFTR